MQKLSLLLTTTLVLIIYINTGFAQNKCFFEEEGFTRLFNGKDLTGWKIPEGDNGHWSVIDEVIDYDARSEAKGDKNLWTEKKYKDFKIAC